MSRPTVKELESSLKNLVRNWSKFGRNLPGIDQAEISKIECNKRDDVDSQKVALYEKWLEVYPDASWDDVINALREADENTLAQTIENKLSLSDKHMSLSPKQPPIEIEAAPNSISADPVQQGEVYDVPECVVDELKELHDTFVPLAMDVQNEIESRVNKGEVTVKSLVRYTGEQRAFPIENHATPINDSQTFLSAIRPHYNFLNPYLLIALAIHILSNCGIAQRAKNYRDKVEAFDKSTLVRSLVNTLQRYHDHVRPTTRNNKIVMIRVKNCLNKEITIWVVQMLIQTLFPIIHPDEVPWYEVCQGSLVLSFIATDNMLLPFIVSCAGKMEFMRLLGIVSVSIENVCMIVNRNTEPFSLENSLIEATASNNVEAVKFLLKYLQVNANVKYSDGDLLDFGMNSPHQTSQLLMPYENRFAELVLDIKKEAEKHKMEGDENSKVAQVINSYYEQLQRQHNFLNTALLSSQSAYLSNDLQQRVKQHCEGIEEIKRKAKLYELELSHFISDSQLKDSKFIPVSLTLCSNWALCGMHNVEQLIKLVFPSVALKHFQWFRIANDYGLREIFMIEFLVPKDLKQTLIDNCKVEEKIAHALGIFMIEVDNMLTFRGRYDMIYGYHFQKGLQIVKQYKNKQAIDLLEQIITQKPIGTSWDIAGRDINNNCQFVPDPDSTPLMIACCNGNEELVQLLLKYNADPNIRTKRNATALIYSSHSSEIFQLLLDHGADSSVATSMKITALHLACCGGNVKVVETMIRRHPSFIDIVDAMGRTPLWFASHIGNLPVVKILLQEKINLNSADNDGVTPLLKVLYNNFVPVANELLKAKADPNCKDKIDESTPLLIAVSRNNLQLVEKLLKMKANPNVINARGESPLWIASVMGNMELIEKLIQNNADLNLYNRKEDKMVRLFNTTTTPLHAASSQGHLHVVDRLLKGKADPNLCGSDRITPLMGAALSGFVEITKRLLQARADPNIQNNIDGDTALTIACNHGHMAVIKLLLQAKADPNIRVSPLEFTALWRACFDGNVLVVERLLQEPNIQLNLPNVEGYTPLLVASGNGHTEIVNRLLQALADPNIQSKHGETPILVAILGGHFSVVNKLLECKIDLNISSSTGQTPLLLAVYQENIELVKRLLKMNANPNVINARGESPLWIASASGNMELVENLLQANANLNLYKKDPESKMLMPYYTTITPLCAASRGGHLAIVDRLLEGKADPNLSGSEVLTPLMGAAVIGSVEITERLLQAQADPNIQCKFNGNTALGIACTQEHIPVIDVLLRAKANPNIPNEATPLYMACFKGSLSVVKRLLREPNIELNARDKWNGHTPLLMAIGNGLTEIVELLLEARANPNTPNNHGETPLLAAVVMRSSIIVEQLLEYEADPNIPANTGETPLLVAVKYHCPSPIIEMLLQANADPTISTPDGTSPLWAAVMIGDIPLIMRLLQAL